MPITETDWTQLATELALAVAEDGWLAGRVKGFPIGVKIMLSGESAVLLVQVRLAKKVEESFSPDLAADSKLSQLIAANDADLSFNSSIAWLTISKPPPDVAEVRHALDEFLDALSAKGIAGTQTCYYCGLNETQDVKFYDGKVYQICDTCLAQRIKNAPRPHVVDLVPLIVTALVGGILGGLAWALVWVGWDQLFIAMKTESIRMPRLVMAIVSLCIAGVAGGPAGWLIKRIPSRTAATAGTAAIVASAVVLCLGEVLYTTILVYRSVGVVAPLFAAQLVPKLISEGLPFFKLFAAGATVILTFSLARPAKPKLDL